MRTWARSGAAPRSGSRSTPLIGFQARNSFGDGVTWVMFAAISVVAAVLAVVALALGGNRARTSGAALEVSSP